MSRHGFRHALDRTIRRIRDPGAIRWAPARRPAEGRILELLLSAAPNIVIAGDAVQQEWGRNLARMLMRIVVRTFPHTRARVSGDPSLQQELASIVADIWPATRPLDAQGPEILVGGVGAPKSKAPIFVGTDHWVARVANQQLDVSSGNGASCVVAASLAASE